MEETLKGRWGYQSFRHDSITLTNEQVEGNPELAVPWAGQLPGPPGVLEVDTDSAGTVTGTLTFTVPGAKVPLKITGRVIPSTPKQPTSVELVGEGPAVPPGPATYRIKGFFIPRSGHVVGTVLSLGNDLGRQPVGTVGPFVLIPNWQDAPPM
jgi:hypothetical protein